MLATSGRQRLNIHAALELEEMRLVPVEGERINAETTLRLFQKLERSWPGARRIHLFLDNARYHHARMLKPWLQRPDCRLKLHVLPPCAPHLNPVERLWGVMHKYVTHNRAYDSFARFVEAINEFFDRALPKEAEEISDAVTDSYRVIIHDKYRLIGYLKYIEP